jgi:hypothetical protein
MVVMKSRMGSGAGLNWATASSMASRRVRMKMRTRTNHTSQFRSSNVDCMEIREPDVSRFHGLKASKFLAHRALQL